MSRRVFVVIVGLCLLLIIAHNMNARQADQKYVEAITTNSGLETLLLLREGTGVGVTLKKR